MGEEHLGAVDDTPEVDVHHPLDVLELARLDVTGECDARVVVDLVDPAEVLGDRIGVDRKGLTLGDVEPVGLHRRADGLQPLLGGRQALGVDVTDRQLGARAGQLDRQRLSDARPGAGHYGDLPGEALHSHTPVQRAVHGCSTRICSRVSNRTFRGRG